MDMMKYVELKAKGAAPVIVKVGAATVAVFAPRFDADTGKPLDPTAEQFNLKGLDDLIDNVEKNLKALRTFRDDVAKMLEAE